jgi:hypothetical protein
MRCCAVGRKINVRASHPYQGFAKDPYQGLASAMPPPATILNGFSHWDCP